MGNRSESDVALVAWREFTTTGIDAVGRQLETLIERGVTRIVFNIDGVEYANSSAVGMLIKVRQTLRESDGDLVLSAPSAEFRRIITTLGIQRVLAMYPTDAEAIEHFAADDAGMR